MTGWLVPAEHGFQGVARVLDAVVGGDGEEHHVQVRRERLGQPRDRRHFLEAGAARLGPKIQQHELAAVVRELGGPSAHLRQLEVRRDAIAGSVVRVHGAQRRARAACLTFARSGDEAIDPGGSQSDAGKLCSFREQHGAPSLAPT
jgi:hypothetical protein